MKLPSGKRPTRRLKGVLGCDLIILLLSHWLPAYASSIDHLRPSVCIPLLFCCADSCHQTSCPGFTTGCSLPAVRDLSSIVERLVMMAATEYGSTVIFYSAKCNNFTGTNGRGVDEFLLCTAVRRSGGGMVSLNCMCQWCHLARVTRGARATK